MKDDFDLSRLGEKKAKRGVNGKRKGARYQNTLAKILNDRFDTKEFSSTPGSGAYATTHNLPEYLKIHGDLITPQNFNFCIEAKCGYKKESISSILDKNSTFWEFIYQAKRDARKAKREFLLVIKQDRKPDICVLHNREDITKYINTEDLVFFADHEDTYILTKLETLISLDSTIFFSKS